VPPHAGVGSAVGLLHADLAIERAKTFLAPVATLLACSASRLRELAAVFAELERAAATDLGGAATEVVRSVGVRFIGQAHAFTVELPAGPLTPAAIGEAAEEFYKRYRESYGIDLRDPVELTAARVRVVLPTAAETPVDPGPPTPVGERTTRSAWFDGAFTEVPVRERVDCAPGEELPGPCLITEPHASLVVPPGWRATVDDHGAVLLTQGGPHE
ncbi:MAG: hydantoinase/oxoprolinase family protein, partial [Actinomadura sp.]